MSRHRQCEATTYREQLDYMSGLAERYSLTIKERDATIADMDAKIKRLTARGIEGMKFEIAEQRELLEKSAHLLKYGTVSSTYHLGDEIRAYLKESE